MSLANAFALHHAVPHIPEQADRIKQVGCSNFAVRKRSPAVALVPNDSAGCKVIVEVVAAPYDVVLAHTKQLVEAIFSGNIPFRGDRIVAVYASFTDT